LPGYIAKDPARKVYQLQNGCMSRDVRALFEAERLTSAEANYAAGRRMPGLLLLVNLIARPWHRSWLLLSAVLLRGLEKSGIMRRKAKSRREAAHFRWASFAALMRARPQHISQV